MKKEILDLGYEVSQVEDGRVTFIGDAEAICRANIFLRTTERVLLKVGSFHAETFEDLVPGNPRDPVGGISPEGREILGRKGVLHQEQAFQSV